MFLFFCRKLGFEWSWLLRFILRLICKRSFKILLGNYNCEQKLVLFTLVCFGYPVSVSLLWFLEQNRTFDGFISGNESNLPLLDLDCSVKQISVQNSDLSINNS